MARTDNLTNYLTDVADAIRTKTGSQATIQASSFDTEIEGIETIDDGYWVEDNTLELLGSTSARVSATTYRNVAPLIIIKKIPYFELSCSGNYGFGHAFAYCAGMEEIDVSGIDLTNSNNHFRGMFWYCDHLKEIDLSSWGTLTGTATQVSTTAGDNIAKMFQYCNRLKRADLRCFSGSWIVGSFFAYCTALEHLDVRNLDFTSCPGTTDMFGTSAQTAPPTTCEIIVADTTQKEWFATNYPDYTNVKTVAEYES